MQADESALQGTLAFRLSRLTGATATAEPGTSNWRLTPPGCYSEKRCRLYAHGVASGSSHVPWPQVRWRTDFRSGFLGSHWEAELTSAAGQVLGTLESKSDLGAWLEKMAKLQFAPDVVRLYHAHGAAVWQRMTAAYEREYASLSRAFQATSDPVERARLSTRIGSVRQLHQRARFQWAGNLLQSLVLPLDLQQRAALRIRTSVTQEQQWALLPVALGLKSLEPAFASGDAGTQRAAAAEAQHLLA